jgi:hypothetical protein
MALGVNRYRTDTTYPSGDSAATVPFRVTTH